MRAHITRGAGYSTSPARVVCFVPRLKANEFSELFCSLYRDLPSLDASKLLHIEFLEMLIKPKVRSIFPTAKLVSSSEEKLLSRASSLSSLLSGFKFCVVRIYKNSLEYAGNNIHICFLYGYKAKYLRRSSDFLNNRLETFGRPRRHSSRSARVAWHFGIMPV